MVMGAPAAQNGDADLAICPPGLDDVSLRKRAAAAAAVAEIEDGMLVGLGTGSTANFAIAALGDRVAEGLEVTTVATSLGAAQAAQAAGLTMLPFDMLGRLDLAIDGADELDPQLVLVLSGMSLFQKPYI